MAKANETITAASAKMTIEKLAELEETPLYILAGLKAANGWGSGKELRSEEYKDAVQAFLKGSMNNTGGRKNG